MYTLLIKPSAERDLRRLPRALFDQLNELHTCLLQSKLGPALSPATTA